MPLHRTPNIPELAQFVLDLDINSLNGVVESVSQNAAIKPTAETFDEFYEQYKPLILDEVVAALQTAANKFNEKNKIRVHLNAKDQSRFYKADGVTMFNLVNNQDNNLARIQCGDIGSFHFIVVIVYLNLTRHIGILNIYEKECQLALQGDCSTFFNNASYFDIYPLASLVNLDRMYNVCVQKPQTALLDKVMRASVSSFPSISNTTSVLVPTSSLNLEQKHAAEGFIKAPNGVYLLQGPPGTGKTTTIVNILQQLMINNESTLVCAPSNKAIQVLAERMLVSMPFAPLLLIAVENKITSPRLQEISFDNWINRYPNRLKAISQEIDVNSLASSSRFDATTVNDIIDLQLLIKFIKNIENKINIIDNIIRVCMRYVVNVNPDERANLIQLANQKLNEYLSNLKCLQQAISINSFPTLAEKPSIQKLNKTDQTRINSMITNLAREYNSLYSFIVYTLINQFPKDQDALFERIQILFSTLSITGRMSLQRYCASLARPFQYLIIDEAGQAVEAEALIPFNLAKNAKKALLVGDTRQLPATTIAITSKITHFDHSMMWRLLEGNKQPYHLLTTQYRMRGNIKHFPSNRYYEGRLIDHESIAQRPSHIPAHIMNPNGIKLWLDTNSPEEHSDLSFINRTEATSVIQLICAIREYDTKSQIGVISFYSAQIKLISSLLKHEQSKNSKIKLDNIEAHTVDGFQGDEKDIIILSFVRGNQHNQIGFLNDFRRLNVAITRAKDALYIIGNASTFRRSPNSEVGQLLDFLTKAHAFKSFNEVLRQIVNKNSSASSSSRALPVVTPIQNVGSAVYRPAKAVIAPAPKKFEFFTIGELMAQANRYYEKTQYDKAIENCRHVLEDEPNRKEAYQLIAKCYKEMGKTEEAQSMQQIADTMSSNVNSASSLSSAHHISNSNHDGFTTISRKNIKATLKEARELCDKDKFEEAESIYSQLVDDDFENSEVLLGLGWVLNKQRRHKEAERYFELSLKFSKTPLAYQGLIQCKNFLNNHKTAIDLIYEALDYFPWSRSIAALRSDIETRNEQPKNTTTQGEMNATAGTVRPLLSDFLPSRLSTEQLQPQRNPSTTPTYTAQVSKGKLPANKSSTSSSVPHAQESLSEQHQAIFIHACIMLDEKKEPRNAEAILRELHKIYPHNIRILEKFGWCLHILKRNAEAITLFEEYLEKAQNVNVYYGLARCYRFTDDIRAALDLVNEGLKYFSDARQLLEYKKELNGLSQKLRSDPSRS